MKSTIILLAGYPATGKTYLLQKIKEKYPQIVPISPDAIKEDIWDIYGFNGPEEKAALERKSWRQYYEIMEKNMKEKRLLISDYPFSDKQKGKIKELTETYGYQVITVRLTGREDVLFLRSRKRDMDTGRHLGHLVSRYHKGDILPDRREEDSLLTYACFKERCEKRGYARFVLGHLIELDVTEFEKIDYPATIKQIDGLLR